MKNTHLVFARLAFAVIGVGAILITEDARAQGCGFTAELADCFCSAIAGCPTNDDSCASKQFTPPCTGMYTLAGLIDCADDDCEDYNFCISIYNGATPVYSCVVGPTCDCAETCGGGVGQVCLTGNTRYSLYVCLTPCDISGQCPPSSGECCATATLTFYTAVVSCP
ncbi:hypothetical protein HZB60_10265 [candidate division KSB1 bacterium]|nr:hypothetical protein [candidate division KSB1 bacterium]